MQSVNEAAAPGGWGAARAADAAGGKRPTVTQAGAAR